MINKSWTLCRLDIFYEYYGGLRQKSWECQDSSDNALHTKLGSPSEGRARAVSRTIDV